jgi:hypothetical protein
MAAKQEVKQAANAKQLPPAPPPPNAALVGRALPPGGVAGGVPIEVRAGSCMMHVVLLHDARGIVARCTWYCCMMYMDVLHDARGIVA